MRPSFMAHRAPEALTDILPDCPHCGSPVQLVTDGMIAAPTMPSAYIVGRPFPYVWRLAAFGACTGCEFCIEVRPKTHYPMSGAKRSC